MSILGFKNKDQNMGATTPFLHEFKKQASFFLKEKIKTARLALTDVTPAQLLAEEATNGNPGVPDARTLKMISRAAFEIDDYWRIVEILHRRLVRFDRNNWRVSYRALLVLEHLLTHGPESISKEFQSDKDVIREIGNFQHIDEKGFNWGLNVRKKSERISRLLENSQLLKEERQKARKITRGIQGFGSFSQRTTSAQDVLLLSSTNKSYERSNSQFNDHGNQDAVSSPTDNQQHVAIVKLATINDPTSGKIENSMFKENVAPKKVAWREESDQQSNNMGESRPLLAEKKADSGRIFEAEDHPFDDPENLSKASLLAAGDHVL